MQIFSEGQQTLVLHEQQVVDAVCLTEDDHAIQLVEKELPDWFRLYCCKNLYFSSALQYPYVLG